MLQKIVLMLMISGITNCSIAQQKKHTTKSVFEIDGKIATQKEFEKLLATLKEVPDTYFCAITTKGGRNGFDAKDTITGIIYEYFSYTEGKYSKSSITKKEVKETFEMNGKVVTQKEFKSFLATLKELPGTWFCKETTTGGSSGYAVKDTITGIVYQYVSSVVNGNCKSAITKKF